MVGILFTSLFGVACSTPKTEDKKPTYTYTETDDGIISNPNFTYGTIDTALTAFPKTSVTGWSRSKDANATTNSSAKSGVIKVTDDGWKELLNSLYNDSAILNYLGTSKSEAKEEIKAEKKAEGIDNYSPSNDEIKAHIIKKIEAKFVNPSIHTGAKDSMVYMLNNYLTESLQGKGTSQKITSSTEVTLNKGEYVAITVWLKTVNLNGTSDDLGASIRLTNTFNGSTQSEFALINIDTLGEWKPYTVYAKADAQFDTTVKIGVGLGYSLNHQTEGTVYIDDIEVKHLENLPSAATKTYTLDYNGDTKNVVQAKDVDLVNDVIVYDMSLDTTAYNKAFTPNGQSYADYEGKKAVKIDVIKSNHKLTLSSSEFSLDAGKYAYVEFYTLNKLSKFGNTNLTVNVKDIYGSESVLRAAVASVTQVSEEWQKIGLVIKNNFETGAARTFEIELVVGPTDLSAVKNPYEYATGTVYVSQPTIAKGLIELPDNATDTQEKEHNLFSLFSGKANGSTALYAGFSSDYTDSSNTETYALTTSPSSIGKIISGPASVSGYQGIVSNHFYIKEEVEGTTLEKDIDTRTGNGENGSFAGLINTKYLTTYESKINGLTAALDFVATETEKNIQPIMIYNKTADSYGFIGQSKTISASSYAKISVTLRVVGDANAYVYLVDVSDTEKTVMTFDAFTDLSGNAQSEKKLSFVVDKNMMDENGWVTVDFYVATGATAKNFRVEVWNGGRDGIEEEKSQGFVFFKNISVSTSSAFSEPTKWTNAFTQSGNPLYTEVNVNGQQLTEKLLFKRALTQTEIKYNSEQTDSKKIISYQENYVWASNATMIYAIYNTIDPVEVDPYKNVTEDTPTSSGCTAETDPSTFWLSFSSILLGVALVLAIIMLFIKNIRRRRRAHRSDAKSHYTVTSRVRPKKVKESKKEELDDEEDQVEVEETVEETESDEDTTTEVDTAEDVTEESTENKEENLDEYVYGDVQVFGEEDKKED